MQRRKSSSSADPRKSTAPPLTAEWDPFAPAGPQVAFHAACVIRGAMYVHGGVTEKDGKFPSQYLHKLDFNTGMWSQIRVSGSPALSHHCAVAIDNRYMLLIGGWNGKQRTADVFAFDAEENRWMPITAVGFPEGGGLSSHTANLIGSNEILVIGREGSLLTQRRHGSAYLLTGSVLSGRLKYSEYSQSLSSRSGHTANFVGTKLYIIGGRSDHLLEVSAGYSPPPQCQCSVMKTISDAAKEGSLKSLPKMPCGRKGHVTVPGPNTLLIYGGETFDGRSREPVGDMIVIHFNQGPQFYTLGVSRLGRAGHVCVATENAIIMHGGLSGRSEICGDAYKMKLQYS